MKQTVRECKHHNKGKKKNLQNGEVVQQIVRDDQFGQNPHPI